MIPLMEMERLLVAAVTASALAHSGQKQVGREWLMAGFMQALDSQTEGHEWAPGLVRRWEQVLDAYCAEFALAPLERCPEPAVRERVPA